MKTINKIQYFLFAIILLGMFASFAQNEYSSILLNYPYLFIGLLFIIEIFFSLKEFRENQSTAVYSFFERLGLGLFFCGTFFMAIHWVGAVLTIMTGGLILLILYFSFGIKTFFNNFRNKKRMSLTLFCLAFATCLAMIAYIFKLQHRVFAGFLTVASGSFSFLILLLIIFNIKMLQGKEKINFRDCLRQIKTKLVLAYAFFSFWTLYFTLVSCGIAPRLYSLANPPALDKMYQEQNPAADVYRKNYQQFLDSRKAENNNQSDNLSKKK